MTRSILIVAACLYCAVHLPTLTADDTRELPRMLGGFQPATNWENDATVDKAAKFAVSELSSKGNGKLELLKVHSVEKQVVAGTNYRMKLEVKSEAGSTEGWTVTVWEKLPHEGSTMQLTNSAKSPIESCSSEGNAQAVAQFAAQHVSQMSNSLIPLQLQEVVEHEKAGDKHSLKIKVGRDGLTPTAWQVVVEEASSNNFKVTSVAPVA